MFLRFLLKHMDHAALYPSGGGGSCVDLANLYLWECYALPAVRLNAADWAHALIPGFVWVANGPWNYPPQGAIVVWGQNPAIGTGNLSESTTHHMTRGQNPAIGTGPYGHVALAVDSDSVEFLSFDQNWPAGHVAAFVSHSYTGVLGWHCPPLP